MTRRTRARQPHNLPWTVSTGQILDDLGNVVATRHAGKHRTVEYGTVTPTDADDNCHAIARSVNFCGALRGRLVAFGVGRDVSINGADAVDFLNELLIELETA